MLEAKIKMCIVSFDCPTKGVETEVCLLDREVELSVRVVKGRATMRVRCPLCGKVHKLLLQGVEG